MDYVSKSELNVDKVVFYMNRLSCSCVRNRDPIQKNCYDSFINFNYRKTGSYGRRSSHVSGKALSKHCSGGSDGKVETRAFVSV